ncbi:unnamed protein product, partial [Pylaiella littoralis]
MDVVRENSRSGGGGGEGHALATTTTTTRRGAGGGLREELTATTTGLDFVRLMEAVLSTLRGGGAGCDETSCAALRLLLVLSTADDSQKAALRTPRVLHAALAFFTPDTMGSRTSSRMSSRMSSNMSSSIMSSSSSSSSSSGSGSAAMVSTASMTAIRASPRSVAADVTARLLLTELLPPHFGETNGNIAAALEAPPSAFAGAPAVVATAAGAAQAQRRTGGTGGRRRVGHAPTASGA